MPLTVSAYSVVRRATDSGKEWLSTELQWAPTSVKRRCKELAGIMPTWAEANPVVRIVRVRVVEEETIE